MLLTSASVDSTLAVSLFYAGGQWQVIPTLALTIGVIAGSYLLAPFNVYLRTFLEGRLLPPWIASHLTYSELLRQRRFNERKLDIRRHAYDVHLLHESWKERLKRIARSSSGVNLSATTWRQGLSSLKRIDRLTCRRRYGEAARAARAFASTLEDLHAAHGGSEAIGVLGERLLDAIIGLSKRTSDESANIEAHAEFEFANASVQPTPLGNRQAALGNYAQTRYGLDFEVYWAHLTAIKASDETFEARYGGADTRLEFMVNMLFVSLTVLFSWPFAILVMSGKVELAAATALLALIASFVYYHSVVETQRTVIAGRRTAVDLYRAEVAKQMRMPTGANAGEEFANWDSIHRHILYSQPRTVPYDKDA